MIKKVPFDSSEAKAAASLLAKVMPVDGDFAQNFMHYRSRQSNCSDLWVLLENDCVVGHVGLEPNEKEGWWSQYDAEDAHEVVMLVLNRLQRGEGYGSKLVDKATKSKKKYVVTTENPEVMKVFPPHEKLGEARGTWGHRVHAYKLI